MDHNCLSITGRVWKDPQKFGESGVKFGVLNGRGNKEKPVKNYFNVICFGKTAEFVLKYVTDGRFVAVAGEHNSREYEGKTYWDLIARDVVLLPTGEKRNLESGGDLPGKEVPKDQVPKIDLPADDPDIPF